MTKVVINACFGGFSLSSEACRRLGVEDGFGRGIARTDPRLVAIVEELGAKASSDYGHLIVVDVPEGARYRITEYDGWEDVELRDEIDWQIA